MIFLNKQRNIKKEITKAPKPKGSPIGIAIVISAILGMVCFALMALMVSFLLSKTSDFRALLPIAAIIPIGAGCFVSSYFAVKKTGAYLAVCIALSVIYILILSIIGSIAEPSGAQAPTYEIIKLASIPVFCLLSGRLASDGKTKRRRRK